MKLTFIETPNYTKRILALIGDEQNRALQNALLDEPERGDIIPQSGGLRKLRWKGKGHGKSGGIRVVYYLYPPRSVCYLIFAYPKNEQDTLTSEQLSILHRIVTELLQ